MLMMKSGWLLGALVLGSGAAVAADATLDAARRCTQVKDSLERLVCFDRAFAGSDGATSSASVAALQSAPPVLPRAPAPAAPVAAAGVTAPAAAPAFGDDQVKRTTRDREVAEGPKTLTARVSALKEMPRASVFRLTLDNDQVWQQMDMDSHFSVDVGDTVQIEKGKLGGYRLARISNGRSSWVRVTRLN